jgi:hypothetical protein
MIKEYNYDKKFRIMYIFPQEVGNGPNAIYTYFLRISNYLNLRKDELNINLDEIYVDLRFEDLPPFNSQNSDLYLKELKILINKIFNDFPFDLVAISCYSSYEYLNTIVLANLIKSYINPKVKIIIGGYHASIFPGEFQPDVIPRFIYDYFPEKKTLFNYIIKGEGEIAFFKLIKKIIDNDFSQESTVSYIEGEAISSLNDLPLIDLSLLERYKDKLKNKRLNLDFGRGCMFQCTICLPKNDDSLPYHKNVRFKSIERCIEELKIIKETKWLEISSIAISDPIFLPKRSLRNEFYEKYNEFIKEEGDYPYNLSIYDRVDLCSRQDLIHYKKFNITPYFGFESASVPMLKILNKINSNNENEFEHYIKKVEELIIFSNKIDLNIWMFLIIGLPGETKEIIQDNRNFFLEKRFNGKSLSEKYKIILDIRYYKAIPGSTLYDTCEEKYGGQIFYKNWWRLPLEDHRVYNKIVKPSKDLDYLDSLKLNYEWIKEFISFQIKNNTPYFNRGDFKILREGYFKFSHLYKNGKASYYSFIPESWKSGIIYP